MSGVLSGCGGGGENGKSADNGAGTERTEDGIKTINMYTMGIGNTSDYKAVQDAINGISREKIGVEVNWTVLDIGQWFEQYNLLLSGSEPVDLMVNMGGVSAGVSQGAFLELDELYAEYGKDIAVYYDEEFLNAGRIGGNLYGIAGQKDFAATRAIAYRKDIHLFGRTGYGCLHLPSADDLDLAEHLHRRRVEGQRSGAGREDDGV